MNTRLINAADAPAPVGGYSQAIEVRDATRLVYVSGQIPAGRDGDVPKEFRAQARLAWSNVERQLVAAGMSLQSIVKHTTYLADRKYRDENREVRQEVLGEHRPALTVVIADIFDVEWLLEIEVVAAG